MGLREESEDFLRYFDGGSENKCTKKFSRMSWLFGTKPAAPPMPPNFPQGKVEEELQRSFDLNVGRFPPLSTLGNAMPPRHFRQCHANPRASTRGGGGGPLFSPSPPHFASQNLNLLNRMSLASLSRAWASLKPLSLTGWHRLSPAYTHFGRCKPAAEIDFVWLASSVDGRYRFWSAKVSVSRPLSTLADAKRPAKLDFCPADSRIGWPKSPLGSLKLPTLARLNSLRPTKIGWPKTEFGRLSR